MKQYMRWILFFAPLLFLLPVGCSTVAPDDGNEILIGVKSEYISLLVDNSQLTPAATGISSLDTLNHQWGVIEMTPVYPNLSPDDEIAIKYGLAGVYKLVVPTGTNISGMIQAYQADPHIEYAERNVSFETK
jgi:hypothetical protein